MPDTIPSYDSMAAFYAAIGGTMEQVEGFTVHPMEEVHAEAPYVSPLFRANYYSIVLIRTGGEQRISNFLLWGAAYAELHFSPRLWPEFDAECFYAAIASYQRRERRFGRVAQLPKSEASAADAE